jgi:hypothetical protein
VFEIKNTNNKTGIYREGKAVKHVYCTGMYGSNVTHNAALKLLPKSSNVTHNGGLVATLYPVFKNQFFER